MNMDVTLYCPVCDREMTEIWSNICGEISVDYRCDRNHERVIVKYSYRYPSIFVYLGDGCYLVTSDNTSCERAIARMRREYEENK